jgi:hypothetical protein
MRYFFYLIAGLGLVIFQTAIMPCFSVFEMWYDMLIPFVLYLSVFCPFIESIIVIAVYGFLMDSMSGGVFGLYTVSYLWVFVGMRRLISMLHIADSFLMGPLTAIGILVEDAVVFGTFRYLGNGHPFPEDAFFILSVHLVWAVLTGGIIVWGLRYLHKICDERGWRLSAKFAK